MAMVLAIRLKPWMVLVPAKQLKDMDQIVAYVPSEETKSTVTSWF